MNAARFTTITTANRAVFLILALSSAFSLAQANGGESFGARDFLMYDAVRNGGFGQDQSQSRKSLHEDMGFINESLYLDSELRDLLNKDANYYCGLKAELTQLRIQIRTLEKQAAAERDSAKRVNLQSDKEFKETRRNTVQKHISRLEQLGMSELGMSDSSKSSQIIERLEAEIAASEKTLAGLRNDINSDSSGLSAAMGHAAVYGLVGKDGMFVFRNMPKTTIPKAMAVGATYRAMSVVGDLLQETIQAEGTELWNTVVGGSMRAFKDAVKSGYYWLFHGGDRPFKPELLDRWKIEVLQVVLEGLEKRARDSQKEQSSGRDARMRALLDVTDSNASQEEVAQLARETDPVWQRIAQGYANDLERLALRIEAHKPFYSPKSDQEEQRFYISEKADIIALAGRLQETLHLIKDNILLPSGTLKDLAEGDMKLFLQQLAKELKERFELLNQAVRAYHGLSAGKHKGDIKSSSSTTTTQSYSHRRPGYEAY